MWYSIVEDIDVSQSDFQTMLDELTDAKNSLVQHNGYMPRQWAFGLIPRDDLVFYLILFFTVTKELERMRAKKETCES